MLIDARAVDAMAASEDEGEGEATIAMSNVSRNVTQMQQSDEQTDPGMEARCCEMDELINALPSIEQDMLRAYFVTQPSSPDTAATANRGGPTTPM